MTKENTSRQVLLLNSSWEVMRIIGWQRAVNLYFTHKAVTPTGHDDFYSITTNGGVYTLPSVLVLKSYVNIPYHSLIPSRKNIFRRDGLICQFTGKQLTFSNATIDHVLPTSRGGVHSWENCVTCDRKVNQKKGDRTPAEAGLKLLQKPKKPSRAGLVLGLHRNEERWHNFMPKELQGNIV